MTGKQPRWLQAGTRHEQEAKVTYDVALHAKQIRGNLRGGSLVGPYVKWYKHRQLARGVRTHRVRVADGWHIRGGILRV